MLFFAPPPTPASPSLFADLAQTSCSNPPTPRPPDESGAMGGCLNHRVAVMGPTAPSVWNLKEEDRTHPQHNQQEQLASIWRGRTPPPVLLPPPLLCPERQQQEPRTCTHTRSGCSVSASSECRGNIEPDAAAGTIPKPSVFVPAVRQSPSSKSGKSFTSGKEKHHGSVEEPQNIALHPI